jgi:hypothetical protein
MLGSRTPESTRGSEAAFRRGLESESRFREMFSHGISKSSVEEDMIEHWDFNLKFDVKKIRSTDEFGESNYHWVEIYNVNGDTGWLYGKADYVAFETLKHWVIVPIKKLKEYIDRHVVKEYADKKPYYLYRREGRKDKLVMVPTIDLCALGFMVEKHNPLG